MRGYRPRITADGNLFKDVVGISGELESIYPELAVLFEPFNYWARIERCGRMLQRMHRLAIRGRILKVAGAVSAIYADPDDAAFARLEAVDREVQPFYGLDEFLSENYERALAGFATIDSTAFAAWQGYPELRRRFLTAVLVPFLAAPRHGTVEQRAGALLKGVRRLDTTSAFAYAELLERRGCPAMAERVCARLAEVVHERLRATIDPPTFVQMGSNGLPPWRFVSMRATTFTTAERELSEVVLQVRRRFDAPARRRVAALAEASLRATEELGRRSYELAGLDTSFYRLQTEGAARLVRALRSDAAGFRVGRVREAIARDNREHVERLLQRYGERFNPWPAGFPRPSGR